MVLINELTVEQINAALLHLQRSKGEVVGGVKGNTTQNISITNSGGGGGNNVDYSGAIQNLANNIEKNSESIEGVKVDVHNLEETIRNLSDAGISDLSYDNLSHQLTITTENGDTFQAQIIQDVATLSFDPTTNELSITTGEQTQTITLPAQVQSDWTQTDNTEPDFIKNKIPIWITDGGADDNMSPVDVVEPGNTRPVTSGGVSSAISSAVDDIQCLKYGADIRGTDVDDLPIDGFRVKKVRVYDIGWEGQDGFVINLPWSSTFGRQIAFDDKTDWIATRTKSNNVWGDWVKLTTTADIDVAKRNITRLVEAQNTFSSFAELQAAVLGFSGLRFDSVSLTSASGDPNAPITTPEYYWWNVITCGFASRQTQIATQAFIGYSYTGALYVRSYHDNRWSDWYQK